MYTESIILVIGLTLFPLWDYLYVFSDRSLTMWGGFSFITSGDSEVGYSYFYRSFIFKLTIAFINSNLIRTRLGCMGNAWRITTNLDRTNSFVVRFVRCLLYSVNFVEGVILIFVPPNVWSYYRHHDTSSYVSITSERLVVLPTPWHATQYFSLRLGGLLGGKCKIPVLVNTWLII